MGTLSAIGDWSSLDVGGATEGAGASASGVAIGRARARGRVVWTAPGKEDDATRVAVMGLRLDVPVGATMVVDVMVESSAGALDAAARALIA